MVGLKDVLDEIAPGRSLLQYGARSEPSMNAGPLAAAAGSVSVKLVVPEVPFRPGWLEDVEDLVRQEGAEFEGVPSPIARMPTLRGDARRSDLVVCDDIIFHLADPYRVLLGLARLAKERVVITTSVVPSSPPDPASPGDWPIWPGFVAFSGALADEERSALIRAFDAYGMSGRVFERPRLPLVDPAGFEDLPDAWRWIWTTEAFEDLLDSVGLQRERKIDVWDRRGFLYVCRKS